jgi:Tfp pilus assembly protein PilX
MRDERSVTQRVTDRLSFERANAATAPNESYRYQTPQTHVTTGRFTCEHNLAEGCNYCDKAIPFTITPCGLRALAAATEAETAFQCSHRWTVDRLKIVCQICGDEASVARLRGPNQVGPVKSRRD